MVMQYISNGVVMEMTPEQEAEWNAVLAAGEAQKPQLKAQEVRAERTQLLKDSDWTQVADAPVDKAAWATYRQALRDVPSQAGFPWDVQWPTQPE